MKEKIIGMVLWIVVLGIIYLTLTHLHTSEEKETIKTETKVVHDTIVVSHPIVRDSVIVRKDTVRLRVVNTTHTTDTMYNEIVRVDSVAVEIPIERKTYEDSVYFAVVSGYHVSLDSIRVTQRNTIVERYIQSKPKRWGLGIVGGYGLSGYGLKPFVGVGVSYNLWQW